MSMVDTFWQIATRGRAVDAVALLDAATSPEVLNSTDARTRLLARDSLRALQRYWGPHVVDARLLSSANRQQAAAILSHDVEEVGFPTLEANLMKPTEPAQLYAFLRELGLRVRDRCSIAIGGSLALMVDGILIRHTEDIDVVNELPDVIRREHALLDDLSTRYRLKLTHFQSHYLPTGWDGRTRSLGIFGQIEARVVDPLDVLAGKLFSRRTKDLDDFRLAWANVDQPSLRNRIATRTDSFRADPSLREAATQNWYIVTGESALP
jgi:hypothetical protein